MTEEDESELEGKFDFSNPIRGKFANVRFPIFIDNSILGYFHVRARATGIRMEELVNEALRHHVNAAGYVPPVFPGECETRKFRATSELRNAMERERL